MIMTNQNISSSSQEPTKITVNALVFANENRTRHLFRKQTTDEAALLEEKEVAEADPNLDREDTSTSSEELSTSLADPDNDASVDSTSAPLYRPSFLSISIKRRSTSVDSPKRNLNSSLSSLQPTKKEFQLGLKKSHSCIQFAEEVRIHEITPLQKARIDDMFYSEEEMADMRYEAFMEKCGLDPNEFE
jgi:hypothetical protein